MNSTTSISGFLIAVSLTPVRSSLLLALTIVCILPSASLEAQHPEVHEERFHVPLYEWDCLRFLNVRAKPGDTTAYHVHRNPIIYLTMEGAEVWLDDAGKSPRVVPLTDGWVGSDVYGDGDTLLHRFAVRGEKSLHILAVEITGTCSHKVEKPLTAPFYSDNGFEVYAIAWEEYIERGYFKQFPAIVPPLPITREGWVRYSAGHILKPVAADSRHMHAPGVEVLWVVLPK